MLCFYLGLISFLEDSQESADAIFKNAIATIEEYGLKMENLTSIGADNTNVNFGSHHSVYSLFKERLPHLKERSIKSILMLLYFLLTFRIIYSRQLFQSRVT